MSEDKPVPWAEITAPTTAKDCQKCGLALQRARVIRGEGNPGEPVMRTPAELMQVGVDILDGEHGLGI